MDNIVGSFEFSDFPVVPEKYGLWQEQHVPQVQRARLLEDGT